MPIYYEAKALERAIDAAPRITPSTKSVLKKIIRSAPVADAEPVVHGRKIEDGDIGCFWLCSLCGECLPYGAKYCPSCGARMELEVEEED